MRLGVGRWHLAATASQPRSAPRRASEALAAEMLATMLGIREGGRQGSTARSQLCVILKSTVV